jgi:hypothetical protein
MLDRVNGGPELTADGRYVVIDGRRWRATDPAITDARRTEFTRVPDGVAAEVRRTSGTDGERAARDGVQAAKVALGERRTPGWEQTEDERRARWSVVVCLPVGEDG